MTLDTAIYVRGPVDHKALFLKCNQLIGATERTRSKDEQDTSYHEGEWIAAPGNAWTIMNEPGQGLPGWLMVHYRPGAPLHTAEDAARHDEDCEPDCDGDHYIRACWLRVSLDTAYSYSDAYGGCGDLHARFVAALGAWLDERKVPWSWKNEFTGEVHQGTEGLDDLGSRGAEAAAWVRKTVLPAIAAGLGGGS